MPFKSYIIDVNMYNMSCIEEEYVKEEIIKAFTKDCNLRIVIDSTAFKFGMEVDFYDVNKSFSPSGSTDVSRKLGVLDIMAIFLLQFYYVGNKLKRLHSGKQGYGCDETV